MRPFRFPARRPGQAKPPQDAAGRSGTGAGTPPGPTPGPTPGAAASAPRAAQAEGEPKPARPPWPDLSPLVDGTPAGRLSQRQMKLWSLVLRARRVPHRVRSLPGGYTVQVPPRFARQAVDEILLYQQENVSPHPSIPLPEAQERSRPTVAGMLALCAFYSVVSRPWPEIGLYPQYWRALGLADAGRMLSGELWRAATALTLHADPAHAASNAVIGGAFMILLARRAGSGTAWLAAVLAGILGNLLNAVMYALLGWPGHLSLGFSTAVFGAAGVLAGLKAASGEGDFRVPAAGAAGAAATNPGRGWLLPVAAGLALLATLGMEGENTDLGAHVFGLMAGFGIGGIMGRAALRLGRPDEWAGGRFNVAAGALAVALPVLAWAWAWLDGSIGG